MGVVSVVIAVVFQMSDTICLTLPTLPTTTGPIYHRRQAGAERRRLVSLESPALFSTGFLTDVSVLLIKKAYKLVDILKLEHV